MNCLHAKISSNIWWVFLIIFCLLWAENVYRHPSNNKTNLLVWWLSCGSCLLVSHIVKTKVVFMSRTWSVSYRGMNAVFILCCWHLTNWCYYSLDATDRLQVEFSQAPNHWTFGSDAVGSFSTKNCGIFSPSSSYRELCSSIQGSLEVLVTVFLILWDTDLSPMKGK